MKRLFGRLNSIVADGVQGLKDIIGYHWENAFLSKLQETSEEYTLTQKQYSVRSSREKRIFGYITDVGVILSIIALIISGENDVKIIFPLFALVSAVLTGVQETLSQGTNYGFVFGAAKRVFDVLKIKAPVSDSGSLTYNDIVTENRKCAIQFNNVVFSYQRNKEIKVLNDVSFTIQAGEKIAIVSASGGGKSTSAKLIQRFWDVESGSICINGINIKQIKLNELRKIVTVVPQETYLFNGTIKENLLIVKPDAIDEEILRAIEMAQADKFIKSFEQGIQTVVGENGTLLSGGEKQRIALAQAFLADTPILVLDEATSALDSENETLINDTIKKSGTEKTVVMIAHRLSTIMSADKIVFIKNNKVNQIDTFDRLIDENQYFKELVRGEYIDKDS